MYLNRAIIIGNLTRDPELKALPSGIKVANFSLATNRYFKDKEGKRQEQVDYHNVVVFGRTAELAAQYLKKGSQAMIEGRIQNRSWDKADGTKGYRSEIVAETVQFGNRPGGAAGSSSTSAGGGASQEGEPIQADAGPGEKIEYPKEEINPDDIPF